MNEAADRPPEIYPHRNRLPPPQPERPEELTPAEKVDNCRSVAAESQWGQRTSLSAWLRDRNLSKVSPQFLQRYSYKGMALIYGKDAISRRWVTA